MILWVQLLIIVLFIVFNWDNLTGSGDDPDFQNLSKLSRIVLVVGGILFVPYLTIFKDVGQDRNSTQAQKLDQDKRLADKANLVRIISSKYPVINNDWIKVQLEDDRLSFYGNDITQVPDTLYLKEIKKIDSTQYFYKKGVSVKAAIIIVLESGQKVTLQHNNYRKMVKMRTKIKKKWYKIKPNYDPVENPRTWSDRFKYFEERSRRNQEKKKTITVQKTAPNCNGKRNCIQPPNAIGWKDMRAFAPKKKKTSLKITVPKTPNSVGIVRENTHKYKDWYFSKNASGDCHIWTYAADISGIFKNTEKPRVEFSRTTDQTGSSIGFGLTQNKFYKKGSDIALSVGWSWYSLKAGTNWLNAEKSDALMKSLRGKNTSFLIQGTSVDGGTLEIKFSSSGFTAMFLHMADKCHAPEIIAWIPKNEKPKNKPEGTSTWGLGQFTWDTAETNKKSPTITFKVKNKFTSTIDIKFYTKDLSRMWPRKGQVYSLTPSDSEEYTIQCHKIDEVICYGAYNRDGGSSITDDGSIYTPFINWGCGKGCTKGCTDCCYRCTGATEAFSLTGR